VLKEEALATQQRASRSAQSESRNPHSTAGAPAYKRSIKRLKMSNKRCFKRCLKRLINSFLLNVIVTPLCALHSGHVLSSMRTHAVVCG
jgi:hypothetical protein